MEGFLNLPAHTQMHILSLLDEQALASFAQTCKAAAAAVVDDDVFWKHKCLMVAGTAFTQAPADWGCGSYRELYAKVLHFHRHLPGLWVLQEYCFGALLWIKAEPPCINVYSVTVRSLRGPPNFQLVWSLNPKAAAAAATHLQAAARCRLSQQVDAAVHWLHGKAAKFPIDLDPRPDVPRTPHTATQLVSLVDALPTDGSATWQMLRFSCCKYSHLSEIVFPRVMRNPEDIYNPAREPPLRDILVRDWAQPVQQAAPAPPAASSSTRQHVRPCRGSTPDCTCTFPDVSSARLQASEAFFVTMLARQGSSFSAWITEHDPDIKDVFAVPEHQRGIYAALPAALYAPTAPCHPLAGLWRGTYGAHGLEVILIGCLPDAPTQPDPDAPTHQAGTSNSTARPSSQPATPTNEPGATQQAASSSSSQPGVDDASSSSQHQQPVVATLTAGGTPAASRLCGVKVVGDVNVPAGAVSLYLDLKAPPPERPSARVGQVFSLPPGYDSMVALDQPAGGGPAAPPLVVRSVHTGLGLIAGVGFESSQWTVIELITFNTAVDCPAHGQHSTHDSSSSGQPAGSTSDADEQPVRCFGVLWHQLDAFSLFTRLRGD